MTNRFTLARTLLTSIYHYPAVTIISLISYYHDILSLSNYHHPDYLMIWVSLSYYHPHDLLPEVALDTVVLPREVLGSVGIVGPVQQVEQKECQREKQPGISMKRGHPVFTAMKEIKNLALLKLA